MFKKTVIVLSLMTSSKLLASDGLITIETPHTVTKSADKLEKIIEKKGLTLFARINHSNNAEKVKQTLSPTELIIFGNPKVGTPLMKCDQRIAIDLPQKVLFWEDESGKTRISYNDPNYLKDRHNLEGCDKVIEKVSSVLRKLSQKVAE